MTWQDIFRLMLGAARLSGCAVIAAKPPTCAQPVGKWNDEVKSVMAIQAYDPATGALSGQYISRSGAGSWPMVGWVNSVPAARGAADKGDHAEVFALLVRWGERGSVTAWTGTCTVNAKTGLAQIASLWHTARPDTGFEWGHMLTGSEVFVPIE